jgi:hypothetical protein
VHLQQKQRALDDASHATNSALNRPSANRDSNATGMVHVLFNSHVLLISLRTSH